MAKKKAWYEKGPVGVVYKAGKDTVAEIKRIPANFASPVAKPAAKVGETMKTGITDVVQPVAQNVADTNPAAFKRRLGLSPVGGGDINKDFGTMIGANEISKDFESKIGANEDPNAISQNIKNQYSALGSLAKLREGANAQSEQNAIQRRLASTGMGSSGAGLRMQNLASQQSARRGTETQLGIAAEQAGKEAGMQESAIARNMQRDQMRLGASESVAGRNLQRDQMRLGASESAAGRNFATQLEQRRGEQADVQLELDRNITASNQSVVREIDRYNKSGLLSQLFGDFLGRR